MKCGFENPWLKFQPPILVSSYLNFLIQPKTHSAQRLKFIEFSKANSNWVKVVDFTAPFMIELAYLLKGRILYPSLYPAEVIEPSICYIVQGYNRLFIVYKSKFIFTIELFDRTNLLIISNSYIQNLARGNPQRMSAHLSSTGIPSPKHLYAVLQGYCDAEELDEKDEQYEDISKLKVEPLTNESEYVFKINFRRHKNIQPMFKKLFDYLKCHWIIREIERTLRPTRANNELMISYGPTQIPSDQISVRLSPQINQTIKTTLQQTYSFYLRMINRSSECKEIEELFNIAITHMSAEACYKYLKLYYRYPMIWNCIVGAYKDYV